ncbi:uncharacterized protein LOC135106552 isoform X2 [Scylla paramamosain]|uniref:uncharacterized protein LOC135106552 isoform X2 n=1 Tax=Scylla paramamosain TaxID=85552 RepID=UPI003082C5BE
MHRREQHLTDSLMFRSVTSPAVTSRVASVLTPACCPRSSQQWPHKSTPIEVKCKRTRREKTNSSVQAAGMNYIKVEERDRHYPPLVSSPPPPIEESQYPSEQEPWVALVMALSKLLGHMMEPYIAAMPDLPLDWATALKNANFILDKTSPTIGPLRGAVVGMAAMAIPIVMQVARAVVDSVASLLDNTVFVVTGHGLGRRSVPSDVTEELTDLVLRLIHLVTRHLGRR